MKNQTRFVIALIAFALGGSAVAATFVVPPDQDLIRRADAIVIATAGSSYAQLNRERGVETVTPMDIEEVIKGNAGTSLDVVEPGGTFAGISMAIPGVPRFEAGERMLLLLAATGEDRWSVTELVLGKFTFSTDVHGRSLLVRDEDEIVGWDPNLKPHREAHRDAALFLRFVRTEASGGTGQTDYVVEAAPLAAPSTTSTTPGKVSANVAPFSANSYTMTISGSMGSRWTVFPNGVNWFSGTTQEPGAPNGGVTAITTGMSSWNNDCGSNVNYVYAGTDNGTHTQGLHAPDGANTVLFEQDLSAWGVAPFSCSANGYSGTLGIGGITSASGTNTLGSETFVTTNEADVMMNKGIANCTLLFSNGDWNSAVTHELGHTLGFRHADQNRPDNAACSTDPSLECSSSAIMTAFVTQNLNATLQAWDQHAVQAVYPGNVCAPTPNCTPPAITQQPSSATTTAGSPVTLTVGVSGTGPITFQWYAGASGNTSSPIPGGTAQSITVTPTTTTSFWVQVTNSCGTVNSATATVTITAAKRRGTKDDFDGDHKSDFAVWRPSDGHWYIVNSGSGVDTAPVWGLPGDILVPADYDGDGKTDVAVFRPSEGRWYILNSSNGTETTMAWGLNGDIPVPGDYDGDGKTDMAVFRPSDGHWYIINSSNGTRTGALWGLSTDIPVPGDYDGDGKTDIAVFRPSAGTWYVLNSSTAAGTATAWGLSQDIPVERILTNNHGP